MSISKNMGAFASYLAKIRISKRYRRWKAGTSSFLNKLPLLGKPIYRFFSFVKRAIKNFVYHESYFEDLGLYYIGPVNGNDYSKIEKALKEAKDIGKCAVIHAFTKKGKGYEPAEKAPDGFHSLQQGNKTEQKSLHSVFAEGLVDLASENSEIVAVTAAMGIGTGLDKFGKSFPKRYFDVGIAEEHALTFSAGLAAAGLKPYVAIYSTFLQRGYDNVIHDIALQNLPVRMIIDRAGLAVSDGATHHGIFDVAFLSHVPGVSIYAPVTYGSLMEILKLSVSSAAPMAIRYSNTSESEAIRDKFYPNGNYSDFGALTDYSQDNVPENVFVTYGSITERVIEAQKALSEDGIKVGIVLTQVLKPYFEITEQIAQKISGAKNVLFVEEGIKNGGFSMICENYLRNIHNIGENVKISIAAIEDNFAAPSKKCNLYQFVGLSSDKLAEKMKEMIVRNDT